MCQVTPPSPLITNLHKLQRYPRTIVQLYLPTAINDSNFTYTKTKKLLEMPTIYISTS